MTSFFPVVEAPARTGAEMLHDYLIERNPEGVRKVLMLHGYRTVTTEEQMREALLRMAARGSEAALFDLIEEHPDYDLIVADYERKQVPTPPTQPAGPVVAAPHKRENYLELSFDLDKILSVFMFLVLVWLVLKIFKD